LPVPGYESRFEASKLHKKLLCLMGETNFSTLSKTEKLKRLCGQDPVGFEYKGLTVGAAYDFNLSGLSVNRNNYNGVNPRAMGFEVALSYIAKIYKDLVIEEVLYNPRF
jgi:hypothetical protein